MVPLWSPSVSLCDLTCLLPQWQWDPSVYLWFITRPLGVFLFLYMYYSSIPKCVFSFLAVGFFWKATLSSTRLMQSQQINCTGRKPEAHTPPFSKPTTTAVPASSWDPAKNGTQDRWVRDPVLQTLKLSHRAFPRPALEPSLFKTTTINQRL